MTIDHLGISAADLGKSRAFYGAALAPLGMAVIMEGPEFAGIGAPGKPEFWLSAGDGAGPIHVAFRAADRAQVRAFHAAAIAAGGTDNGAPGLRPQYHVNYYGAFVLDPDGNNVEAVCHVAEG